MATSANSKVEKIQTPITQAVSLAQNTVVSVITYQKNASGLDSFYEQLFENGANEEQKKEAPAGEGSGVIYKKSGNTAYIVTNNHVVEGAEKIEIKLADGTTVGGELVGADTYSDLAVVKIKGNNVTSVAQFADSNNLTVGETAIAIGSPLGSEYANSVTAGIVSSLSRTVTSQNNKGENISTNAIQTDAAINPGNSGGALINSKGQVIGINSSKITASSSIAGVSVEGMGFAIPSNDVQTIIKQLEKNGSIQRPALGISMVELNNLPGTILDSLNLPEKITSGIVVAAIQDGMPADGILEKYDLITKINNTAISSSSDLQSLLYKHNLNDTIEIEYYRDGNKKTSKITLDKSTQDLKN